MDHFCMYCFSLRCTHEDAEIICEENNLLHKTCRQIFLLHRSFLHLLIFFTLMCICAHVRMTTEEQMINLNNVPSIYSFSQIYLSYLLCDWLNFNQSQCSKISLMIYAAV